MDTSHLASAVRRELGDVPDGPIRDNILRSINLVDNYTRGHVAEALVATACDGAMVGEGYGSWDVTCGDIRIEVKASGLVQSWPQRRPSRPEFSIAQATGWLNDDEGMPVWDPDRTRRSDVYVFCLHEGIRPDDPAEWTFYVVPTARVDAVCEQQESIRLASLQSRLQPLVVPFERLADAVNTCADGQKQ